MGTGVAIFGERGISGTFGFENNELHRRVYLLDPANNLDPLLQVLFGSTPSDPPLAAPEPFNSFVAWSMSFETAGDRGSQGDTEVDVTTGLAMLANFPTVRGGVVVDITYRPMDTPSHNVFVSDEGWDFSAQTMSLIGNSFANNNPQSLKWSDDTAITNITAIVKIIPKLDFVQTQVFRDSLPAQPQSSLIGSINAGILIAGAAGLGTYSVWEPECALLSGLPAVRRWRWDGQVCFQWGIKLAINNYKDNIEGGYVDYVGWNRLYRPDKGYWDRVKVGPSGVPLYPEADLSQVVA